MKNYLKTLFFATLLITINTFAYQATTEEGQKVQKLGENYKKILSYYKPFTYVYFTYSIPELRSPNHNYNYPNGRIGQGAYAAKGGKLYSRGFPRNGSQVAVEGINGESLYGATLSELFDIAALLDSDTQTRYQIMVKAYSKKQDKKVQQFGKTIGGLEFILSNYDGYYIGLTPVLQKIEPNGKNAIDPNKNYSEAAVTKEQVMAINHLNYALFYFYDLLKTPEEVDAFFNYVAAFVDNSESPNNNAIVDTLLPEDQKNSVYPTPEEAQHHLLRDIPIIKRSVLTPLATNDQIKRILEGKGTLYEYFFAKVTDNNSDSVKQYSDNLKKFLADYTEGYKRTTQDRDNGKFHSPIFRYDDAISGGIASGQQGQGTYAAVGGEEFTVSYKTVVFSGNHYIGEGREHHQATTYGITGQPLYGYKLYELFEAAINLELYSSIIDTVFSKTFTDPKVAKTNKITQLKKALVDFQYEINRPNLAPSKGLLNVLYYIEPNGISGIDLNKNYSDEAVDSSKVQAINDLNIVLKNMSQTLKTNEDYDLFFNYVATFIDNGGTKDSNVIINSSQNLGVYEFQKYIPLPTNEEVMESVLLNNNDYIKPMELTRISNDEDLNRILGKEYDDLDPRTEEFKKSYIEAIKKAQNE